MNFDLSIQENILEIALVTAAEIFYQFNNNDYNYEDLTIYGLDLRHLNEYQFPYILGFVTSLVTMASFNGANGNDAFRMLINVCRLNVSSDEDAANSSYESENEDANENSNANANE